MKSINELTKKALASASNNDQQTDDFFNLLRDNMEKASSKSESSFYLFLVFITVWTLIYTATVGKVSVLGIEISNTKSVLLISFILSVYSYYRFATLTAFVAIIDDGLTTFYSSRFKSFHEQNITELLCYPSFYNIEHAINELQTRKNVFKKVHLIWKFILIIFMLIVPIIALCWIWYLMLTKTSIGLTFSIISGGILILLVGQALLAIIQLFLVVE